MPKRYFSTRDRSDRVLFRVFLVVTAVIVVSYGVYRVAVKMPGVFQKEKLIEKVRDVAKMTTEGEAIQSNLEHIQKLIANNSLSEAKEQLRRYISTERNVEELAKAYILFSEVEFKEKRWEEAVTLLQEATQKCSTSLQYPIVLYRYGSALEQLGKQTEARSTYQQIVDTASKGNQCYGYLGLARLEEKNNKKIEARNLAQQAVLDAPWDSSIWNESLDLMGRLNVELIFSNIPTPESKTYTVQKGDSLITIGVKLNTPVGMLCRANNLSEDSVLRPNQVLKYTPKDFRVIVERSKCRVFLVDEHGIFKRYIVGLGKHGHETTLGTYKIGNKQKNPTWFKPGEGPIPPGDPRNQLGTRWMPLVPAEPGLPTDLGLHGTIEPETIGTYSSNGCVRFTQEDIEELYDLIVRSTPVIIKEEVKFEDVYPIERLHGSNYFKDNLFCRITIG